MNYTLDVIWLHENIKDVVNEEVIAWGSPVGKMNVPYLNAAKLKERVNDLTESPGAILTEGKITPNDIIDLINEMCGAK